MTNYEPKSSYYSLQDSVYDTVFEERFESITRSLFMKTFRCQKSLIRMVIDVINDLITKNVDFFIKTDDNSITIVSLLSPGAFSYIKINGVNEKLKRKISNDVISNLTPLYKRRGNDIYKMFSYSEFMYVNSYLKYETYEEYEEYDERPCVIS